MLSEIKTVLKQNMINREAYKKWVVVGLYCLCFLYSTAAIIFHCMLSAIDAAFGAVFLNTSLWNNKVRNSKKKNWNFLVMQILVPLLGAVLSGTFR